MGWSCNLTKRTNLPPTKKSKKCSVLWTRTETTSLTGKNSTVPFPESVPTHQFSTRQRSILLTIPEQTYLYTYSTVLQLIVREQCCGSLISIPATLFLT